MQPKTKLRSFLLEVELPTTCWNNAFRIAQNLIRLQSSNDLIQFVKVVRGDGEILALFRAHPDCTREGAYANAVLALDTASELAA